MPTIFKFSATYFIVSILWVAVFPDKLCGQNTQKNQIEQMHMAIQEAKDDTSALHLYQDLVGLYFGQNLDSVLFYCDVILKKVEPLIERSTKDDNAHLLYHKMEALANKGYCFSIQNKYNDVIENHLMALPISETIKDSIRIADICSNLGMAYYVTGEAKKGLELQNRALEIYQNINDTIGISLVLNNLGSIFSKKKDYKQSAVYYEKALVFSENTRNINGLVSILNNIGTAYRNAKENEKALVSYNRALKICGTVPNCRGKSITHNNIAQIYFDKKDYQASSYHYKQSIEISKNTKENKYLAPSYLGIAEIDFTLGNYKSAKKNALIVLEKAKNDNNYMWISNASDLLYKINKKLGSYQEALEMHELFRSASDSLNDEEMNRALADQKAKYFYDLKAAQDSLEQLEKNHLLNVQIVTANGEKKQAKQRSLWLIIGLVVVLFFTGLIYYRFRLGKQQNELIKKQSDKLEKNNAEKELLLKEIHHRVKNNLQVISSLLELQSQNITDESALSAVSDGQTRVKSMALIHQNLYQNQDIGRISFKDYAEQLVKQISAIYGTKKNIDVVIDSKPIFLDIDTSIPLGLILNELISNSYKYAFKEDAGKINIKLEERKEGSYVLSCSDSGVGLPEGFDISKTTSLGLKLVRRLCKQLYGTVSHENKNGTNFTITFKDTDARKTIQ